MEEHEIDRILLDFKLDVKNLYQARYTMMRLSSAVIANVIAGASFKNDLKKAIEMGENVGFNEDGGYDYFSQSDAFEAVVAVLKKHLL